LDPPDGAVNAADMMAVRSALIIAELLAAVEATAVHCMLPIGLMLPDARMTNLATTGATTAAFSIRFANADDDVGWVAVAGAGAVNVLGNVTVTV